MYMNFFGGGGGLIGAKGLPKLLANTGLQGGMRTTCTKLHLPSISFSDRLHVPQQVQNATKYLESHLLCIRTGH